MSAAEPVEGVPREGDGAPRDPATEHVAPPAGKESSDVPMRSFDGIPVERLRAELRVPELHLFQSTGSTLDVAHRLGASGAPHGTLVLADQQTQGRGRAGKSWSSPPGTGLWLTILARPSVAAVPQVLTVRLGLAAAKVLDRFSPTPLRIKWPNDLFIGDRKLAGVLVEARWRGSSPEWLAVGMGINVTGSAHTSRGASLGSGTARASVLQALMPVLRAAIDRRETTLDAGEIAAFDARDLARGAACTEPTPGVVQGINSTAELLVATATGTLALNSGSLVLSDAR